MTKDLFAAAGWMSAIPLPDAELHYVSVFPLPETSALLFMDLIAGIAWRTEHIVVWGKKYPQPRLIAWYGDAGRSYTYSGIQHQPLPWTAVLQSIRRSVEAVTETAFNSVLLNYYRDQNDSMGMHSDDEPELGPEPVIASLSLGDRRTFVLKHKRDKSLGSLKLVLEPGSLLVMKGVTQRNWKHGIEKQKKRCGARINLTFRRILTRE